ncbi:MAG: aminotransferase class I/II-fold pyridoxal phosphate-dependent enzyme [Polyangiaceae bacterium]
MLDDVFLPAQLPRLISDISARKARILRKVHASGASVIDAFHGEMRFSMHPDVEEGVLRVTREILSHTAKLSEDDGAPYSKSQPEVLRRLAAEKLFVPLRQAGLQVEPAHVLVSPYSSLLLLEAALAAVARPGGVVLCPRGFYKANASHVGKVGLRIRTFPVDTTRDGRIDAKELRRALWQNHEDLCAVLLTLPGNPLVAEYSRQEIEAIGRVLVESGARVLIDAAFGAVQPPDFPLSAVTVRSNGRTFRLYERCVTVTGTSKSHHAVGPFKIGAAATGDSVWRAAIARRLTIPFQRETTALARVVLEKTPDSMIEENRRTLMDRQREARVRCDRINERFGAGAISPLGSSQYGPFMALTIRGDLLARAGIRDGWQLADALLAASALDVVAGPRMGFQEPVVRVNIDAPRRDGKKDPALFEELFARIEAFMQGIQDGKLTYRGALDAIAEDSPVDLREWLHRARTRAVERVAVLRETTEAEKRVAITPQATRTLVANGFEVVVEAGAGAAAGLFDADYVRAGATIAETKEDLYRDVGVVTWVKPPDDVETELSRIPRGAAVLGFMNPFGKKSVLPLLEKWGLRELSLELLPMRRALPPSMDALAAMSRIAGRIALEQAIALREKSGGRAPHTVLVIGAGHAGIAAARQASMTGSRLVCASRGEARRAEIESDLKALFVKLPGDAESADREAALLDQRRVLRELLLAHRPTIVISTARRADGSAPRLLLESDLALLPESAVVVDLSAAAGGTVDLCVMNKTVRGPNGVWICNRTNYPSAEPLKSSSAIALCLAEILSSRTFLAA